MAQNILPIRQNKIWSPIVQLNVAPKEHRTKHPSRNLDWKLASEQILSWNNFSLQVRQYTSGVNVLQGQPPLQGIPTPTGPERVIVARESGVTGRYNHHVGQLVSEVSYDLGLPVFADVDTGKNYPEGCSVDNMPDFVLIDRQTFKTCLVAEVKVPWNTNLDAPTSLKSRDILMVYGQLAKYMDDCHCRYGVVTTYHQTVFVKRVSDYGFARSPSIIYGTRSLPTAPPVVSVKEPMLYMAFLAGDGMSDSRYPNKIGKPLFLAADDEDEQGSSKNP